MQNLLEELKSLLAMNPRFVNEEGTLIKQAVIDAAQSLDIDLLQLLLTHDAIKRHFFQDVGGIMVFDKVKMLRFVSNKAFLEDSYTAFKNKIGLMAKNTDGLYDAYLSDSKNVVLAYPFKDCMLEGGQTKEEQKRKEIFWNETLAPDDIDRLKTPKAFANAKRYTADGIKSNSTDLSIDDNYLVKGNNLLTLYSLLPVFEGKIKLIYIDPPYNNGVQTFGYNDAFNHSTWLTFMKDRLQIAKKLLREDGSIFINLDDKEVHYCKVLADEIFGRENFVANVVWQKKYAASNDSKGIVSTHDHILIFGKSDFRRNLLPRTDKQNKLYKNDDNDGKGLWRTDNLLVKTFSENYVFPITNPKTGKEYYPPEGSCWRGSRGTIDRWLKENRIFFGKDSKGAPQLKRYLNEVQQGILPTTWWSFDEVGHNDEAKKEVQTLELKNGAQYFSTPKPERLLERILTIGTEEGDLVLDFFAGSGTTAAVALKMNRKFITCEQMDYAETITAVRLKKVLEGEQGGVSEAVGWQGGGSFVYLELAKGNQHFVEQIQAAATEGELLDIWARMQAEAFISHTVSIKKIDKNAAAYNELSMADKKRFLIQVLDKNMLYVPYPDLESEEFGISESDKATTKAFYDLKNALK